MRNIPLVPQSDIFVRRQHVPANHPRQAANLLTSHWIALVGHGGAAALLAAKMFFGLAHFGALQVANLHCNFFQQSGNQRQRI